MINVVDIIFKQNLQLNFDENGLPEKFSETLSKLPIPDTVKILSMPFIVMLATHVEHLFRFRVCRWKLHTGASAFPSTLRHFHFIFATITHPHISKGTIVTEQILPQWRNVLWKCLDSASPGFYLFEFHAWAPLCTRVASFSEEGLFLR